MAEVSGAGKICDELKERGVRLTPQRQAILEYLRATRSHPKAEEIFHHVRKGFPGVSLATIYNNLNVLVGKGLVVELSYGDMASRFDGDVSPHYHVTCERCGKVVNFYGPSAREIETQAARETSFVINSCRIELYGVCPNCHQSSADTWGGETDWEATITERNQRRSARLSAP